MCSPVKFAHSLPKKCRNTNNWELCVICQINTNDSLSCTTEKGRDTLFDVINKRQDDVYRRLYDEFNSLSLVPVNEIKYHRSCYKAYTSKRNLQWFVSDVPESSNTSNDASVSTMKTRSKTLPQINWDYCIFCRQKAIKKDRKFNRIENSERVKYILNAARSKFHYDLLSLLTVDDVQEKAQYHSACIANYLLKWKKDHSADNYSTIKNESEHDIAFKKFLDILHRDLFENKKAFTMSSLLDQCCSMLPEDLSTKYSTDKLQTRLQNHYGITIVIESQKGQGQSNIVFSSSISAADDIRAASKLKADLKFSEVEASFVDVPDMQEDQILHDAAKVLRGSLHTVEISKDFYPSPSDLSHHRSLQFIPPSLMTFLSWLVDDNCFHIESDYNTLSHDKVRKFIAVAEMIISLHKNNFTPFNLG